MIKIYLLSIKSFINDKTDPIILPMIWNVYTLCTYDSSILTLICNSGMMIANSNCDILTAELDNIAMNIVSNYGYTLSEWICISSNGL